MSFAFEQTPKTLRQPFGVHRIERRSSNPTPELSFAEVLRRADQARVWNLSGDIEEALWQIALRRDLDQRSTRGMETAQTMDVLRESPIEDLRPVGEPGINQVETGLVQKDNGQKIRGYLKPQYGENTFALDQETRQACSIVSRVENGILYKDKTPFVGAKKKEFDEAAKQRMRENPQVRKLIGEYYGIDADRVPLNDSEFVIRHVDSGHAFKAEYSASVQDRLLGFGVVKPTALRELDGQMATFQEAVDGVPISDDIFRNVMEKGPAHPGAKSLMRLACLDYLIDTTDRHANNFFFNDKTGEFFGIDNGFSNGYSKKVNAPGPDGKMREFAVPFDPYYSFPMELVQLHDDWFLDDEAVQSMKNLFNEVKDYLLFIENDGSADLPESVKQGAAYHALNNIYKLLHERLDQTGRPTPESQAIAKKEVIEFLKKLNYLIVYRKPPELSQDVHSCVGMKSWVEDVAA